MGPSIALPILLQLISIMTYGDLHIKDIYKEINTKIHQVRSGAMIRYNKELFYKKSNINIPLDSNKNIYNYKDYHKGKHL